MSGSAGVDCLSTAPASLSFGESTISPSMTSCGSQRGACTGCSEGFAKVHAMLDRQIQLVAIHASLKLAGAPADRVDLEARAVDVVLFLDDVVHLVDPCVLR